MRTLSRTTGASHALVHSVEGIEIARGCESTIWERSVEHDRNSDGYFVLARERVLLDGEAR